MRTLVDKAPHLTYKYFYFKDAQSEIFKSIVKCIDTGRFDLCHAGMFKI